MLMNKKRTCMHCSANACSAPLSNDVMALGCLIGIIWYADEDEREPA